MIEELNKKDYYKIIDLAKEINPNFDLQLISDTDKIIVYVNNDKVVGYLQYNLLYETLDILNICVDKSVRREHIGTKLINYILKLGEKHIMLEVRKSNDIAINFYKNNNFKIIRTIKNYYDNEDGLSMERVI